MFFSKASAALLLIAATILVTATQPTTAAPSPQTRAGACTCTVQPILAINGACFCGPEAEKVQTCIRSAAPNFPFAAPVDPAARNRDCPSPNVDPAGFARCISDRTPRPLANTAQIAQDCVRSTGARPTSG
ncbi:hypothetical protein HK102_000893 [Quaeritorhiza haematococci]|nr:hypothetical protein HK102_000893 [Quaeritorhiza haematococci]